MPGASDSAASRLAACFANLEAVRRLVRDVLGCGCPEEVFADVAVGLPSVFGEDADRLAVELVVGRRLLIRLVATEGLVEDEPEARALLTRGRAARDAHGLHRFRLVLVGPVPAALLARLEADAARLDDRTHVHQLPAAAWERLTAPGPTEAAHPAVTPQALDLLPTRDGYDRWAEIYDAEDNPLIVLEERHVTGLVGDVRGLEVVDLGCGTGRHAITLAAAGARVTAVDFSESMLASARAKPGAADVRFVVHDLRRPLPFPEAAFDLVLCCLVLEHIGDLDGFFREVARVCRLDGRAVLTAMHPAMMLRGITARFTDPTTGRETRPQSYANQIADYVMAAARAGLRLDHLSEHPVDEELAARSPRSRRYLGWPLLLAMRLRPTADHEP
jgi:malonyl-CoA O-methyltransferase